MDNAYHEETLQLKVHQQLVTCDAVCINRQEEKIHYNDEWNSSVYTTDTTTNYEQMVLLDVDQRQAKDDAVNNAPIMFIKNFDGTLSGEDNEENFRLPNTDELIQMIEDATSDNLEINNKDGTGYYKLMIGWDS